MKYFNAQPAVVSQEHNLKHHVFQEFNQLDIDQSSFDDSNEVMLIILIWLQVFY